MTTKASSGALPANTKRGVRPATSEKIREVARGIEDLGFKSIILMHFDTYQNVSTRYLTGYPGPCVVFLTSDAEVILVPWDRSQAERLGVADRLVNWDTPGFKHDFWVASFQIAKELTEEGPIATLRTITHFLLESLRKEIPGGEERVIPSRGVGRLLATVRATKTPYEIKIFKETFRISREIIDRLIEVLKIKNDWLETELANVIRQLATTNECELVPIGPFVASSNRSWEFHPEPYVTKDLFNQRGLGLIDFGVVHQGYCSDVCIPVVVGKLTSLELKIKNTIDDLMNSQLIDMARPEILVSDLAEFANKFLEDRGFQVLPHSLGHGLGLQVHDVPRITVVPKSTQFGNSWSARRLEENMVIALEPGIYAPGKGGYRLGNDFIVTSNGLEQMTNSDSVVLP